MRLEIYDAQDLNFVELNITGGNDTLVRCDKESRYIDTVVFNIFTPCFEVANKLYDYYGPTKYNSRKIIPLRNELIKFGEKLEKIESYEDFTGLISSHFLGTEFLDALLIKEPNYADNWEEYLEKLVNICKEFVAIAEKCADEERILWVVGY